MAAALSYACLGAALMWLGLLVTPWQPWRIRERLGAEHHADTDPGLDVTAVVPARNEADHLPSTLAGLRAQSASLRIVVVDDQSTDETACRARAVDGVEVVEGRPLEDGWTGKLWAVHQGIAITDSRLLLLVDADITLAPGVLSALRQRQAEHDAALVSVMAALAMRAPWERLLMPAFIFFFKLIYPFALANGPLKFAHAAAGGCMLLRRDALDAVGGVASLRDAVIDDCTLARRLKARGYRTWIGLSRAVASTRRYPRLADTWSMVTRTAYTQLGYSTFALLACTALMLISMVAPVLGLLLGGLEATRWLAMLALAAMAVSYWPTIRYYELPWPLVFTLPAVATLYLAMTWASAWSTWRGVRARWKDRQYASVVTR